ncbi:MAG: MBL fold metallo-hydrolase [Alphaproteobacteria bacterium]
MAEDFSVKFWGVRGSIATPGPAYQRYGGNTSCIEVRCGDQLVILDAGTGIRQLGAAMMEQPPRSAEILMTHTHFDHISGLPFFAPLYRKGFSFRIRAGHLLPSSNIRKVLCELMMAPLFPIPPSVFAADVTYQDFTCGDTLTLSPRVQARTGRLNHPNGATGYRIEFDGRAVCYVTDTEHVPGQRDQAIVRLIEGADMLIYDSTYDDAEYPRFAGWGHSTWQEAVRIAEAAGVRTCVIFHHDPSHDDDDMDRIAARAEEMRPGTVVAREGMVLQA